MPAEFHLRLLSIVWCQSFCLQKEGRRASSHRGRGGPSSPDFKVYLQCGAGTSDWDFIPLQLGVGVPVGCEAIVNSVDRVLEDPGIQPDTRWTLLLDFSNAFNSVSREVLFREVRARLPSMSAWIECCYSPQALLTLGSSTIYSCCGVQQGDPLGPLGFALALHPIIEKVREKVPGLLINAWYLDDGTLCGSPRDLRKALDIIEEDGSACGLHLNRAKSLLFVPAGATMSLSSLPSEIPIRREGFDLLGTPMGSVLT